MRRREPIEMQARVRAAMAFADLGREDIAPLVGTNGVSASTIDRYTGPKKPPPARPRRDYLEDIAAACGFTIEFFYADLVALGLRDQPRPGINERGAAGPPKPPGRLGGDPGRGTEAG